MLKFSINLTGLVFITKHYNTVDSLTVNFFKCSARLNRATVCCQHVSSDKTLLRSYMLTQSIQWRLIEQGYVKTCEQVLGRAKANRKEWISKETWEVIEQRKVAKNTMNMARTRKQKRDANKRYQELNREVKRRCRRDKRIYVESEAEKAE